MTIKLTEVIYTAEAISTGEGRQGHVQSDDGRIALDLAAPSALGGSGQGTNPEQLFAAGYAACFHSAVLGAARAQKVKLQGSSVGARVSIGAAGTGYGLAVELEVVLPGIEREVADAIAEMAHANCPYSNATRGNIEVTITVSDD